MARTRRARIWAWGFFDAPVSPLQGTAPFLALTDSGFRVPGGSSDHGAQGNGPSADVKATTDGTTVAAVVGGPSSGGAMRFQLAADVPAGGGATDVNGRFRFAERGTDVEGRLSCLVTGGPVAVTTGVVTKSKDPAQVGKPVSFSLEDGRIDRVGRLFSWSAEQPPIADCLSIVPFQAPRWGSVLVR